MKQILVLILLVLTTVLPAQMPGSGGNSSMLKAMKDIKGRVYGKIIDAKTNKPVEYASVVVLWFNKDSLIGGALAQDNGDFNVEGLPAMGGFRIKITQIGYKTYQSKFYLQMPNKVELDLGNIKLDLDEKLLNEVEVTADKSTVSMSIDKRSYNVDKDFSVKGGTASDVMKNVPGVTVDGDGNAQLRNQSPTIFVDGRPTTLLLQQIPADQIERIEVITNPSVKYEAAATGGILNIILKKNTKPGYNGMAMAYIGTNDRYGGLANINVKEGKWNLNASYSYNQAINTTKGYTHRWQYDSLGNQSFYYNQDNEVRMKNRFNFAKIGIDYNLTNRDLLSFNNTVMSGNFVTEDHQSYYLNDSSNAETANGSRVNNQNSAFQNYNGQLLYKKTYPKAGKELSADINYNYSNADNGYLFTTNTALVSNTIILPTTYQKNTGASRSHQGVFQLDYVNPNSDINKLELGLRSFFKTSNSSNDVSLATSPEEIFVTDTALSNNYLINEMVNAAYVNYSDKTIWGINYQAGLRFEQSFYEGIITDKDLSFSYKYPSSLSNIMNALFPGIYFSKKVSGNQEWQLNFSRKIKRPNFFQLMPFVMFSDRQNIRIGNPELKPEFRNVGELNYNNVFDKGNYLGSVYVRYEEQPIIDVVYPSLTAPNVLVNTFVNGENSFKYGMEHTLKYTLFKDFDATLNVNLFYMYLKGYVVPTEPEVTTQGFAYYTKLSLTYKLPKQTTLQLNGTYESPKVLLLGSSLPVYFLDLSANKTIGTKWILTATISDAFNTKRMGTNYSTPYYTQDLMRRREARYFRFSVTYMFGKMDASIFKRSKQARGTDNQQGSQDGLDFGK